MSLGIYLYLCSVVIALYAAYIFAFCTYSVCSDGKKEKIIYARIVYCMVLIAVFFPVINLALSLAYVTIMLSAYDYYIDSWLFKKPQIRNKGEDAK